MQQKNAYNHVVYTNITANFAFFQYKVCLVNDLAICSVRDVPSMGRHEPRREPELNPQR
jgi:hypothetical protein